MREPPRPRTRKRRKLARSALILILACIALSYLLAKTELPNHPKIKHFLSIHMPSKR